MGTDHYPVHDNPIDDDIAETTMMESEQTQLQFKTNISSSTHQQITPQLTPNPLPMPPHRNMNLSKESNVPQLPPANLQYLSSYKVQQPLTNHWVPEEEQPEHSIDGKFGNRNINDYVDSHPI